MSVGPSLISVSGQESLPDVQGGQELLPDVWKWSGGPAGCL